MSGNYMDVIKKMKIQIFGDGANYDEMVRLNEVPYIAGFTTNPTLMRKNGVDNYEVFAQKVLKVITQKPISFEVFSDEFSEMKKQALKIKGWAENVNVKIPITNTKRQSSVELIGDLSRAGVKLNVTAMFTLKQIEDVLGVINHDIFTILSLFGGRIADTGVDPQAAIREAVKMAKGFSNVRILWASPRELLNIFQAEEVGCHIITVTSDITNKLPLIHKSLDEYSLDTVKMFYEDAKKAGYTLSSL